MWSLKGPTFYHYKPYSSKQGAKKPQSCSTEHLRSQKHNFYDPLKYLDVHSLLWKVTTLLYTCVGHSWLKERRHRCQNFKPESAYTLLRCDKGLRRLEWWWWRWYLSGAFDEGSCSATPPCWHTHTRLPRKITSSGLQGLLRMTAQRQEWSSEKSSFSEHLEITFGANLPG